jgi:hypothetical protein
MFDPMRAELFTLTESAVLPCGCVGVVIAHDLTAVRFGIERPRCVVHESG